MKINWTFRYAVGTLDSLAEGDMDKIPNALTLRELDIDFSDDGIVLPRFVGVYQSEKTTYDNYLEMEEHNELVDIDRGPRGSAKDITNTIANMGFRVLNGGHDRLHPDLIHLGYDPDSWPSASDIRKVYGDRIDRLSISSFNGLPDFSKKDIEVFRSIIRCGCLAMREGKSPSDPKNFAGKEISMLEEQHRSFGLTRSESYVLSSLNCFSRGV